ncbi:uncharacterized protein LOC115639231 [Gopherus evgoodei]|uniref:uncharacterized protein LOC115639231 n=1 Tax=Gopherus evgoodei TaxID=1825980 RepID=UPI0011CF5C73|nr:uncharacterized protein LOC115639231 [Gopherus evgoodei]
MAGAGGSARRLLRPRRQRGGVVGGAARPGGPWGMRGGRGGRGRGQAGVTGRGGHPQPATRRGVGGPGEGPGSEPQIPPCRDGNPPAPAPQTLQIRLEAPGEHLACLQKAEEERQSAELLKQTEAERQKIVAEWKELREFLEEQEQLLLSQLEELARAIVRRRDEGVSRPSGEISLIGEEGQQQSRSQSPQGAGHTESSREDGPFQKPEPGFA